MNDNAPALAGVVLAAGLSSRMGAFKPLLPLGGQSLIERVIGLLRAAGADPIVVVTGHRRAQLQAHLQGKGVQCVYNPAYAHTQQLCSLRLALAALPPGCGRAVICPADVPLVQSETVQTLLHTPGDFVRPVWQGEYGHPVFLNLAYADYLQHYDGPGGLRGAMERSGCILCDVPVDDRGVVLDADAPDDYRRLLALWEAAAPKEQNEAKLK